MTLFFSVSANAAFTYEDGIASLDLPDGFTATMVGQISSYELSEDALTGSHSLELLSTTSGNQLKLEQTIRIALPPDEAGVLKIQAKQLKWGTCRISINDETHYLNYDENQTWQPVSYYFEAEESELLISFGFTTTSDTPDSTLLLDSFSTQAGIQITTTSTNGRIELEPSKTGYLPGETVRVTLTPDPGFRTGSAFVRTPDQNIFEAKEIEFSEFFIETDEHHLVQSDFQQKVDLGSVEAWVIQSPNDSANNALPEADENGAYSVNRLELDLTNATRGSLRFELGGGPISQVSVSATDGSNWTTGTFKNNEAGGTFQSHKLALPFAPTSLAIGGQSSDQLFSIRNISFVSVPGVEANVLGQGTAEVSYQDSPNGDGSLIATLTATPAEGWSFLEWTGSILSSDPTLELPVEKQETATAHFAERFETADAVWLFVHSEAVAIEPLPEGNEGPLFRLTSTESASFGRVLIQPKSTGKLSVATSSGTLLFQSPTSSSYLNSVDITHLPQLVSAQLAIYGGETSTIDAVTYGELDLLQIDAPDGVVTVSPTAPHEAGDTVTVSINQPYVADFAGWGGSRFSTQASLELTLDGPEQITPIFRRDLSTPDYSLQAVGGRLWTSTITESGIQRLDIPDLAPGEWADLETDFRGPLSLKIKVDASTRPQLMFTQGEEGVNVSILDDETFYVILPEGKTSPLKIGIQNTTDATYSPSFEIHGMYQQTTTPHIGYGSQLGVVTREPEAEFYPVGSKVTLEAIPNEGFEFLEWRQWEEETQRFDYTIKRDETLLLDPVFGMTFESDKAQIPDSNFANWSVNNSKEWTTKDALAPGDSKTFKVTAQGPGVLSFANPADPTETFISVLVNGTPSLSPPQPLLSNANRKEILLESGQQIIEITLTNPEDSQYTKFLELDALAFHAGYAIGQFLSQGLNFTVTPASESHVYPAGSTVTLQAPSQPLSPLRKWAGNLEASTENVTFTLDRHVFTSPLFSPPSSIGKVQVSTQQDNLNAIFENYGYLNEGSLILHPVEETTSLELSIPANTEISFEIDNRSAFIAVHVNDQLVYEGKDEFGTLIGIPIKPQPQTLRITAYFVPETQAPIFLSRIKTLQQFQLSGDFGDANPNIVANPDKDFYSPGEEVTISLNGDAPNDWGFQDLITVYPNLGILDWETERQVRSYTIEMVSDAVIGGRVGPPVSRSQGQVTGGSTLRISQSPGGAPSGGTLNNILFDQGDSELLRIFTGTAKHLEFSAKLEEGQFLILPAYDGPASESTFAGDGEWHAFSLPIPSGQEYLNLIAYRTLIGENDSFYIGDITLHSDYGASYITYGLGTVSATRTTSPTGSIELQATLGTGADAVFWDSLSSGDQTTISVNRVETAPASIVFYNVAEPEFALLQGKRYYSSTTLPEAVSSSVYQNDGHALSFSLGDSIDIPIEGVGPFTLRLAAKTIGYDAILVEADGIEIGRFENETAKDYELHFATIPKGTRSLRIHGPLRRAQDKNNIYDIDILEGFHISRLSNPSGQIFLVPNKDAYATGEQVEAHAIPYANYDFASWTHDRSDSSPSIAITVDGPLELGARFSSQITATSDKGQWSIRKNLQDGILSAGLSLTPSGPGILSVPTRYYDKLVITIDGTPRYYSEEAPLGYQLIYVPRDAKEIRVHVPNLDQANGFDAHFQHGIHAKIVSNTDLLSLSPARETYQTGETVTLNWKAGFAAPSGQTFLLNGEAFTGSLPISYTLEDHLIVDAILVAPSHEEGYYASADSITFPTTAFNNGYNSSTSISIKSGSRESIVFGRHFEQSGTLSFSSQARNTRPCFMVLVNGDPLPTVYPNTSSQVRIPPGGARIEWRGLPDPHYGEDTAFSLSDIRFVPDSEETPFQLFMARSLTPAKYALTERLSETDDYDRDGFSNQDEFEKHSDPAIYDIPVHIQTIDEEHYVIFDLPLEVDTRSISLMQFNTESSFWQSTDIDKLQFEAEAYPANRIRYKIPIQQLSPYHTLLRVAVLLTNN